MLVYIHCPSVGSTRWEISSPLRHHSNANTLTRQPAQSWKVGDKPITLFPPLDLPLQGGLWSHFVTAFAQGPVQRLRQGIRGVLNPIKNLFKPDGKQVRTIGRIWSYNSASSGVEAAAEAAQPNLRPRELRFSCQERLQQADRAGPGRHG